MNVAISSRTPQQALAALLDRYAPARSDPASFRL
jgi:hypothetical protein